MNVKPCRGCRQPIALVRRGENTQRWLVLDAAPIRPHSERDAHRVRVVDGAVGYSLSHMREHLDMRAVFEADSGPIEDFPWHTIHACPAKER